MMTEVKKIKDKVKELLKADDFVGYTYQVMEVIAELTMKKVSVNTILDSGVCHSTIMPKRNPHVLYRMTIVEKPIEAPVELSQEEIDEGIEAPIEIKEIPVIENLVRVEECKYPVTFETLEEFIADIIKHL